MARENGSQSGARARLPLIDHLQCWGFTASIIVIMICTGTRQQNPGIHDCSNHLRCDDRQVEYELVACTSQATYLSYNTYRRTPRPFDWKTSVPLEQTARVFYFMYGLQLDLYPVPTSPWMVASFLRKLIETHAPYRSAKVRSYCVSIAHILHVLNIALPCTSQGRLQRGIWNFAYEYQIRRQCKHQILITPTCPLSVSLERCNNESSLSWEI